MNQFLNVSNIRSLRCIWKLEIKNWKFRALHGRCGYKFPDGKQGRTVDALVRNGDEGRSVAAIRSGEVPSTL